MQVFGQEKEWLTGSDCHHDDDQQGFDIVDRVEMGRNSVPTVQNCNQHDEWKNSEAENEMDFPEQMKQHR
jgi:hypothetical protein